MSDERSPTSAATDDSGGADEAESDGDSSETLEPSGGPRRVVSEQSVDDIIDSLDATKAGSTDSSDAVTTNEPSDDVTTAVDEDDVSAADEDGSGPAAKATNETASRFDEGTTATDEIDLSLDDLETARSGAGSSGGDTDAPADAGPLAGSVDPDGDGGTSDDSTDEGGVLGRLKRFFSR